MCRSKLGNPLNLLIHWQVINWLFQARNRILVFRILLHCGYRKKNKVFACSSFAAAWFESIRNQFSIGSLIDLVSVLDANLFSIEVLIVPYNCTGCCRGWFCDGYLIGCYLPPDLFYLLIKTRHRFWWYLWIHWALRKHSLVFSFLTNVLCKHFSKSIGAPSVHLLTYFRTNL